ncbi:MAG: elongation factor G [Bacteroidetes bacterium GWF2_49_14]|nr:MAG: elongation factor G [Bacteroidetes bacterium GWF2_49_14]HBB93287.1 elongation factor G [Bacteroidales bacterium]
MKVYQTNQIRNLALLGNSGSGKTTLAESLLFDGGVISRRGEVTSKNTVSDCNEIEHERGNSVYSSVLYTEYKDHKINFIDTPGADDFVGATVAALSAVDFAVVLINAQNGVETGTESLMRYTDKHQKPVIFVVNQLDHEKSHFDKAVDSAKEAFGQKVVVIQYPVNEGSGFDTVIDVIRKKAIKYPVGGGNAVESELPASEIAKVESLYARLVEIAAEADENLMELFFANDTLTEEEMKEGLKKGIRERGIFPVLCISAKNLQGTQRLCDFLVNYAPGPDFSVYKTTKGAEIKLNPAGPNVAFVFKTFNEQHLGDINYFRVISGKLTEGLDVLNLNTGAKERISQLFVIAGKNRQKVDTMVAGDIGGTVKLKDTRTFTTLADKNFDAPVKPIEMPEPKYRAAIKAKEESDDEKLGEALHRLHEEDPSLRVEYSKELKQIILHGQGEYHLNIVKWLLDNIHKIQTEYLPPRIPYRETITKVASAMYRHKKQSGGSGQFGEVHMIIEPHEEGSPERNTFKVDGKDLVLSLRNKEEILLDWGGKLVYYNCIVGGSIDARFMPAIQKGLMEKLENGPLTGSYARDIRVYVYDGKMHPVDSNEISFRLAGAKAFAEAFRKAGPKILEPIYEVEVLVPGDRMGDVMSDLQGRRAMIQGMDSLGRYEKLRVKVPLAEMNKYSTSLSSLTNGRATYSMKFSEYALCPPDVQDKLQAAYTADEDE